jgi:hypothetical protein
MNDYEPDIACANARIIALETELKAIKAGYGSLPKLRRVRDELAEENEAQRLRIAELEEKNLQLKTDVSEAVQRAEQAEAILLGEDVTVAAYRDMQAELAALKDEVGMWRRGLLRNARAEEGNK